MNNFMLQKKAELQCYLCLPAMKFRCSQEISLFAQDNRGQISWWIHGMRHGEVMFIFVIACYKCWSDSKTNTVGVVLSLLVITVPLSNVSSI